VIELGDLALALTFLSQSPPTDDGDGRRGRQTDLRKCHDDLQILVASNNRATGRLVPDLGAAARGRALPLGASRRGSMKKRAVGWRRAGILTVRIAIVRQITDVPLRVMIASF
jgi:hypothetical protein